MWHFTLTQYYQKHWFLENMTSPFLQGIGDAQVDISKSGVSASLLVVLDLSLLGSWAHSKLVSFIFLPSCTWKMGIILWVTLSMTRCWLIITVTLGMPRFQNWKTKGSTFLCLSHTPGSWEKLIPLLCKIMTLASCLAPHGLPQLKRLISLVSWVSTPFLIVPLCVLLEAERSVEKGDLSW